MKIIGLLFFLMLANISFSQTRPPEVPADDPYFKLGYLDVRLFGADSTGTKVCTQEIQKALTAAQANRLVCYFPSGTYLIDNEVRAIMPITRNSKDVAITDRRMPISIAGAENPRPIIKLASGASGFGEGAKKSMFYIMAYEAAKNSEWSPIGFNMMIRNMVFDCSGYRGAIGVRFAGAQGSAVEDVKVIATGSFAGFYNCTGQGGGTYNVEVEGGDYAFYLPDDNSRFITMVGITCRNQVKETIYITPKPNGTSRPMLITGFHFVKESGPVLTGWPIYGTGLSMIDGVIEYTGSQPAENALPVPDNSLYMEDVYFKNCKKVILNNAASTLDPAVWTKVSQYVYTGASVNSLINGVTGGTNTYTFIANVENPPAPETITTRHTWNRLTFPSISMRKETSFINVRDATKMTGSAGAALGNGTKIDTKAIQWAIDHFDKIYIPNGTFIIDSTLVLKSKTQLFGAGKTYSILRPATTWKATSNKTMVSTLADANATTSLSFIMFETNTAIHHDISRIDWKAGPNSMIRDIMIGAEWSAVEASLDHQLLKLSGPTAGGRFYCFASENDLLKGMTNHINYRAVLIENTSLPIRFYAYNSERISADSQLEIKNSADIRIYYLKAEATGGDGQAVPLSIINSNNIRVYCLGGNMKPLPGRALMEVNNCTNILAANVKSNQTATTFNNIKEVNNSQTFTISPSVGLSYFSRNLTTAATQLKTIATDNIYKVFPNPVSKNSIGIDTKDDKGCRASFYTLSGVLLHETNLTSGFQTIGLENVSSGPFLLKITNQRGLVSNFKLIKE